MPNTTVVKHFAMNNKLIDLKMTIHILEYIKICKDIPRSGSIKDECGLIWIHKSNTIIPNGLNILD